MSATYYATVYQTARYCAAFRHGVLTIVRLKDQASVTLDVKRSNYFQKLVSDMILSGKMVRDDAIHTACATFEPDMKKTKRVQATLSGALIAFHTIGEKT